MAYSVEKLCFEAAANDSGLIVQSQFCAHGGVLTTHHLSPTSRYGARGGVRDRTLTTAQRSTRIRRASEIEFFNRIGRELPHKFQRIPRRRPAKAWLGSGCSASAAPRSAGLG